MQKSKRQWNLILSKSKGQLFSYEILKIIWVVRPTDQSFTFSYSRKGNLRFQNDEGMTEQLNHDHNIPSGTINVLTEINIFWGEGDETQTSLKWLQFNS